MRIFFGTYFTILGACLFSETSSNKEAPQCLQFTWPRPSNGSKKLKDCSDNPGTPCFKPFIDTPNSPNITELLNNKNNSNVLCNLQPGFACIKYSYIYNNKIENVTRFCGKMMDNNKAISSGCYTQQIEGHYIEACACETQRGRLPCNSASKIRFPLTALFAIFFFVHRN